MTLNGMYQEKSVVEYAARDGQKIKLSPSIIKKYLVSGRAEYVTDQELFLYMGLCKSRGLNPFIRDCVLVKYTQDDPAAIITSIDYYRKRARAQTDCQGWKSGVIFTKGKGGAELHYREGGVLLDGEILHGGWAQAQPTGWAFPMRKEVSLKRYIKRKRDGSPTRFWSEENQPEMIAKVAESQLLRSVWPDEFQGLYVDAEIQSRDSQDELNRAVSVHSGDDKDQGSVAVNFDDCFSDFKDDPEFAEFIKQSAELYKVSEDEVKERMVQNPDKVRNGFELWRATVEPKSQNVDNQNREATGEDPESSELEALKGDYERLLKEHRGVVLSAKKSLQMSQPSTIDGYRVLIEEVEKNISKAKK